MGQSGLPFRIDHDEKFNQTTHLQYQFSHGNVLSGLWGGFNWRYDSGLVAGSVPCYNATGANSPCGGITLPTGQPGVDLSGLTSDQQAQAGSPATASRPRPPPALPPATMRSTARPWSASPRRARRTTTITRRASRRATSSTSPLGKDNIFHTDRYKMDFDLTAINVTNKYALYNFLSTFSGTHYVTPRALTAKITLNFYMLASCLPQSSKQMLADWLGRLRQLAACKERAVPRILSPAASAAGGEG